MLGVGHYQVESIRSRATLDGVERVIEISESGTRLLDAAGAEHVLTERGALTLGAGGSCRLALAVSVDGEEPGISDRTCSWELKEGNAVPIYLRLVHEQSDAARKAWTETPQAWNALPIDGRAAMTTISPAWKPLVILSRSVKPVPTPVRTPWRW